MGDTPTTRARFLATKSFAQNKSLSALIEAFVVTFGHYYAEHPVASRLRFALVRTEKRTVSGVRKLVVDYAMPVQLVNVATNNPLGHMFCADLMDFGRMFTEDNSRVVAQDILMADMLYNKSVPSKANRGMPFDNRKPGAWTNLEIELQHARANSSAHIKDFYIMVYPAAARYFQHGVGSTADLSREEITLLAEDFKSMELLLHSAFGGPSARRAGGVHRALGRYEHSWSFSCNDLFDMLAEAIDPHWAFRRQELICTLSCRVYEWARALPKLLTRYTRACPLDDDALRVLRGEPRRARASPPSSPTSVLAKRSVSSVEGAEDKVSNKRSKHVHEESIIDLSMVNTLGTAVVVDVDEPVVDYSLPSGNSPVRVPITFVPDTPPPAEEDTCPSTPIPEASAVALDDEDIDALLNYCRALPAEADVATNTVETPQFAEEDEIEDMVVEAAEDIVEAVVEEDPIEDTVTVDEPVKDTVASVVEDPIEDVVDTEDAPCQCNLLDEVDDILDEIMRDDDEDRVNPSPVREARVCTCAAKRVDAPVKCAEPEPVVEATPVEEPEPAVEPTPIEEPEPVVEHTPIEEPESEPVVESAPVEEPEEYIAVQDTMPMDVVEPVATSPMVERPFTPLASFALPTVEPTPLPLVFAPTQSPMMEADPVDHDAAPESTGETLLDTMLAAVSPPRPSSPTPQEATVEPSVPVTTEWVVGSAPRLEVMALLGRDDAPLYPTWTMFHWEEFLNGVQLVMELRDVKDGSGTDVDPCYVLPIPEYPSMFLSVAESPDSYAPAPFGRLFFYPYHQTTTVRDARGNPLDDATLISMFQEHQQWFAKYSRWWQLAHSVSLPQNYSGLLTPFALPVECASALLGGDAPTPAQEVAGGVSGYLSSLQHMTEQVIVRPTALDTADFPIDPRHALVQSSLRLAGLEPATGRRLVTDKLEQITGIAYALRNVIAGLGILLQNAEDVNTLAAIATATDQLEPLLQGAVKLTASFPFAVHATAEVFNRENKKMMDISIEAQRAFATLVANGVNDKVVEESKEQARQLAAAARGSGKAGRPKGAGTGTSRRPPRPTHRGDIPTKASTPTSTLLHSH